MTQSDRSYTISRGHNYGVKIEPAHVQDAKILTDWRWLTVSDINGAGTHIVLVREKDLPGEIALAVERAVMAQYDGANWRAKS